MSAGKLAETLAQHRATILRGLGDSPNFEVLKIDYAELVADPGVWSERVNTFFGGTLDSSAMAACVKPSLHRNRTAVPALS